tara:strand:+ start:2722 stop:2853 length:132 start_codon:yes stop_codon:yes gene_type:complete
MSIGKQSGGLWYVFDTLSQVIVEYSADLSYLMHKYPDALCPWE